MKAIIVFCALVAAQAAQLVVFGDSWGTEGAKSLNQVFGQQHGITIDNVAVGGTTAKDWADRPTYLRDVVARNSDAKWVWLTIGGNDAKNELPFGVTIDKLIQELINRTSTFLDPLFKANPSIKVVQFGYDILTFSKGLICPAMGKVILPKCNMNTTCINTNFIRLQNDYVTAMDKLFPRHNTVNLLGTLQAAGKIPGASIGHPNLAYYSPDKLMQDNCIHPNDQGFVYIFNALWDLYFKGQV
jgi:lysophospholipase L1-like esterase